MIALLLSAAALPFAPPIDTPLRYESVDRRPSPGGGEDRFTLTEDAIFTRDGAGYILTIRTVSARAEARAPVVEMFDASMKPFIGVAVRVRVSPDGVPGEVIDAEASWAKVVESMNAMVASSVGAPPDRRATDEHLAAMLATMPPAVRDDQLRGPADDILGIRIPPLDVGASEPRAQDVVGPAGPVHAAGSILRLPDAGGTRVYRSVATSDPAPASGLRLTTDQQTRLSPSSGLMLADTRRISVLATDPKATPTLLSEMTVQLVGSSEKP